VSGPYIDPYVGLGLTRQASSAEIKRAYFEQVRLHPPEREPEEFKRIRAAYDQLRDPKLRAEADMRLLQRREGPVRKRRNQKLDLAVHPEDILGAARLLTDLERQDWREDYRKVQL
jgi:curved DNA-binding protein CbpA